MKIGETVRLAERDYCYGSGDLHLRLTAIGEVEHHPDGAWLKLAGIPLRRDGTPLSPQPREVLVRLKSVPRPEAA